MMAEEDPPSYEESISAAASYESSLNYPSVGCINYGLESDEGFTRPPSLPVLDLQPQERAPLANLSEQLTEDDIRNACLLYVAQHCCYRKAFIRDMELKEILNGYTFHYKLESFGEKRQSVDRSTAYYGQDIDGPENGPAPGPWNVFVQEPTTFEDGELEGEIPHTAVVGICTKCNGICQVRCDSCFGKGIRRCNMCYGRGGIQNGRCASCSGLGQERCIYCSGSGKVKCDLCIGYGKLKHCKLLIVTWKNHVDYFVSDALNLPRHLILNVTGKEIFKEENFKVYPISHVPDDSVNSASSALISKHETAFPLELIRKQRHALQAVPLTKVVYSWKRKEGEFYIYGFQREVYFDKYPQNCCCCCHVL